MPQTSSRLRLLLLGLALTGASNPASAHLVSTRFGEYYAGLLHPLTSLLHLVPWVAMALLATTQGARSARLNLIAFPLAVAMGVVIGVQVPDLTAPGLVNLASFAVLGAVLALARPLPGPALLGLSLIFGASHGYANASTDLGAWDLGLYVAGVASAAYLLIALLGAASLTLGQFSWGRIGVRAVGSWILASGLLYASVSLFGVQSV